MGESQTLTPEFVTLASIVSIRLQSCVTKYEDEANRRKKYTAFVVELRTHGGLQWTVERRFSQFYKLNGTLKTRYDEIRLFKFPPKRWFSSFATATVEQRRRVFEVFLQELLCLQPRPTELNTFLDINAHLYGAAYAAGNITNEGGGGGPGGGPAQGTLADAAAAGGAPGGAVSASHGPGGGTYGGGGASAEQQHAMLQHAGGASTGGGRGEGGASHDTQSSGPAAAAAVGHSGAADATAAAAAVAAAASAGSGGQPPASFAAMGSLSREALARLREGNVGVDDFELLKVLGKGSFGKVFLVRLLLTGQVYAMKVLKKSEVVRRRQIEHTKAERRIMGGIDHPFIVSLRFAFHTTDKLYMVTDYCKGGELFFHLKKWRVFPEHLVRFYAAELVAALAHLHSLDIVYRDLKPENVLLDDAGHVHITDFGLSKDEVSDPRGATTFCGTPEYLAPEMLINRKSREGYGKAVDWWSLGTLIFEMLTGWPPFYDKNLRKMCEQILKSDLAFPSNCTASAEARDLIRGLLQRDPAVRLGSRAGGAEDIRRHPFFKGVDWNALEALRVEPPFKPKVESETDITNFDTSFTSEPAVLTPPAPSELVEAAASGDEFSDFSFVNLKRLLPNFNFFSKAAPDTSTTTDDSEGGLESDGDELSGFETDNTGTLGEGEEGYPSGGEEGEGEELVGGEDGQTEVQQHAGTAAAAASFPVHQPQQQQLPALMVEKVPVLPHGNTAATAAAAGPLAPVQEESSSTSAPAPAPSSGGDSSLVGSSSSSSSARSPGGVAVGGGGGSGSGGRRASSRTGGKQQEGIASGRSYSGQRPPLGPEAAAELTRHLQALVAAETTSAPAADAGSVTSANTPSAAAEGGDAAAVVSSDDPAVAVTDSIYAASAAIEPASDGSRPPAAAAHVLTEPVSTDSAGPESR